MDNSYDIIICGGGCAGLSLAVRLSSAEFSHFRILVLDKDPKNINDRTWSFWTKNKEGVFDHLAMKTWDNIQFHSAKLSLTTDLNPYSYKTIKGIDFYSHCLSVIASAEHITFKQANILSIEESSENVIVTTEQQVYQTKHVFDSLVKRHPVESQWFVWQHFLGWEIQTEEDFFDDSTATFMDFRTPQKDESRFIYVLPYSKRRALCEATIFSKALCPDSVYVEMLEQYFDDIFDLKDFKIIGTEKGKIPMTSAGFNQKSERIIPIGTANGTVKPSSGYAFQRIQKESEWLARNIRRHTFRPYSSAKRFKKYDKTLLDVIIAQKQTADHIFTLLFKSNSSQQIFKFLDEETTLVEEARIFMTLPFWSFLTSFMTPGR